MAEGEITKSLSKESVLQEAERNFAAAREVAFGVHGPYGDENLINYNIPKEAMAYIVDLFKAGAEYYRVKFGIQVQGLGTHDDKRRELEARKDRYQVAADYLQGNRVRENSADITYEVLEEYVRLAEAEALEFRNMSIKQVPRGEGVLRLRRQALGVTRVDCRYEHAIARIHTARAFVYENIGLKRESKPNALEENALPTDNPTLEKYTWVEKPTWADNPA